ncbi:hypothetical protein TESG_00288 [Trichophyton tonsurans CBS 112818]|uniref:Uncharacterized protein n=1 Tax=Trichophyton tonsurans (strain CBS 112818) TaxID=647933 RepID=F2RN18_TRIT1|nr:hypothetical protein TESG_00288 [Trichophyton tonsurans CBS 112818]
MAAAASDRGRAGEADGNQQLHIDCIPAVYLSGLLTTRREREGKSNPTLKHEWGYTADWRDSCFIKLASSLFIQIASLSLFSVHIQNINFRVLRTTVHLAVDEIVMSGEASKPAFEIIRDAIAAVLPHHVDKPGYKDDIELGAALEQTGYTHLIIELDVPFITDGSLREDRNSFLGKYAPRSFLVVNLAARPTAEEALKHPFVSSA